MGIGTEGVVGPVFWQPEVAESGINSSWMMSLLLDRVIPELQTWPNSEQLIYQQDGARPHTTSMVLDLLNNTFPNRLISKGTFEFPATIAWPPRSPDLTPCDYFLWGWMKGRIFHREDPPRTVEELRAAIEEVADLLRQDRGMRERVMKDYVRRLRVCVEREGGHVEIR